GAPELFVIHLRHARAADVAATVNALYGRASALGEPGNVRGGYGTGYAPTLGQQLGNIPPYTPSSVPGPGSPLGSAQGAGQQAPGAPTGAAPAAGMQAVAGVAGRAAAFAGEVTIIPDPGTNALLVRASRGDAELVQAAVHELDVRPLQVLIEVVIAEISKSRAFDLGITGTVPQTTVPQTSGVTGVTAGANLTPAGVGLGDFALRIMRTVGHIQFDATLSAAASRGEARILARPVVLAANNEAAEILVGSQQPFVQVSRALPTDNSARDQVVQYREVGTKLTVKPTISGDGYVSIAVTQEVSAATAQQQFNAPVISTRTVQTVLLVRDSQMVVLGGLMDREHQASQNGIPVLSSIPLLGGLFGHVTRQLNDTEFFLFLTPHIVRTDADAEGISRPYERRSGAGAP
ncbi:MAG TPA: secretin N-terminal domain-containing protein, partial [Gemmatirosa sp.]